MKKILGMLAMALCLIGCNKDSDKETAKDNDINKGPDKVAIAYIEALVDGNTDKAAEYVSKDDAENFKKKASIPQLKDAMKKELEGAKFKVVDTKIDGDKATVKIEGKKDNKTETADLKLVKEDGNWKVDLF